MDCGKAISFIIMNVALIITCFQNSDFGSKICLKVQLLVYEPSQTGIWDGEELFTN
jgi:hypothetical protein